LKDLYSVPWFVMYRRRASPPFVMEKMMKGVRILRDEATGKRFIQIEFDTIKRHRAELEDLFDVLLAEEAMDDEKISWEMAKAMLKKAGKL